MLSVLPSMKHVWIYIKIHKNWKLLNLLFILLSNLEIVLSSNVLYSTYLLATLPQKLNFRKDFFFDLDDIYVFGEGGDLYQVNSIIASTIVYYLID